MQQDVSDFIFLVNLNSCRDTDVEVGINEFSWEEFKCEVMRHRFRDRKDGPGYIPAAMKIESEWVQVTSKKGTDHYRTDANMDSLSLLVIDIDEAGALETAETVFEGYEYIVHSTHNFTPEEPYKYRLIVRLAQPIPVSEWPACFDALRSRIDLDPSCCNPSRFYYYPSHSTRSNIAPRAIHQPGKAITMAEVLALGIDVPKRILVSPTFSRSAGTLPIEQARAKRHFSGKTVAKWDNLSSTINQTYESFASRHARSLIDFEVSPNARHNFALSITGREYYILGPHTQLQPLLMFLFTAARQHGTPLECGQNTVEELPLMIYSAMEKYAPEALEKASQEHGDNLGVWIAQSIDRALSTYEDGFHVQTKKPVETANGVYSMLRERHRPHLEAFIGHGNFRDLMVGVLKLELRNETINYEGVANALFTYQLGYLTKVKEHTREAALTQIMGMRELISGIGARDIPVEIERIKFAKNALLIEISKNTKHLRKPQLESAEPGL